MKVIPVEETVVASKVVTVKLVVARLVVVMLVEETFVEEMLLADRLVEETDWRLDCPVTVRVATVEELARSSVDETPPPTARLPAKVTVPVAETTNCVDEFTWKLRKSPENPAGFMPMKVPETALPPWIILEPSRKSEEEALASGRPERIKAGESDWLPVKSPETARNPERLSFVPLELVKLRFEAVRLVDDTFVEETLLADKLVEETEAKVV